MHTPRFCPIANVPPTKLLIDIDDDDCWLLLLLLLTEGYVLVFSGSIVSR